MRQPQVSVVRETCGCRCVVMWVRVIRDKGTIDFELRESVCV